MDIGERLFNGVFMIFLCAINNGNERYEPVFVTSSIVLEENLQLILIIQDMILKIHKSSSIHLILRIGWRKINIC